MLCKIRNLANGIYCSCKTNIFGYYLILNSKFCTYDFSIYDTPFMSQTFGLFTTFKWTIPSSGLDKSRKENPQKLTQLSSRSHPRHLVGKRTAQKDTILDITSDSQVNSNFPYRWSPASLPFNNCFYLF